MAPFPSADIDTSAEEKHILDMLWESPFLRNRCILNAAEKKKFFFATGTRGQTLGLTIGDAQAALDIAYPPNEAEAPTTCDCPYHFLAENEKDTASYGSDGKSPPRRTIHWRRRTRQSWFS